MAAMAAVGAAVEVMGVKGRRALGMRCVKRRKRRRITVRNDICDRSMEWVSSEKNRMCRSGGIGVQRCACQVVYLFDDGVDGGVHCLGNVQGLSHHLGGTLGDLVLVVDHQGAAVGHHDRICA